MSSASTTVLNLCPLTRICDITSQLGLERSQGTEAHSLTSRTLSFLRDYRTGAGEKTFELVNARTAPEQEELARMAKGFLALAGGEFWPVCQSDGVVKHLQYPRDEEGISYFLIALFRRQLLNDKNNSRYKQPELVRRGSQRLDAQAKGYNNSSNSSNTRGEFLFLPPTSSESVSPARRRLLEASSSTAPELLLNCPSNIQSTVDMRRSSQKQAALVSRVESERFPPAQSSSSSVAGVAHVQQSTEGHTRSTNRGQITMQDIIMQPQESVLGSGCKRSLVVSLKYQKTLDANTTAYSKPRPGSLLDGHHQEEQYGECGAKTIDSSEGRPRKIARLRREADATSSGARLEHDQDASETICVAPVGQSRPVNAQASRSSNCAHGAQVAAEEVGINKTLAPAPDAAAELAYPSAPQLDHDRSTSTASYQPPDKYPPPAKGNQSNHKSTVTAERSSPPIKRELEANPTSPFTEGRERSRSIATPSASSTPLLSPNLTVNTTPESWLDFGQQAWTREPRRSCAVEDSEAELNCRSPSPLGQDLVADRSPSSTTHQMQSTWPDEPRRGLTVNRSSGQMLQRQPPMMAPSPSRSNQDPQSVPAVSPRQAAPDQPPVPVRYIVYWDRPPRAFSKGWPEGKLSGRTLDNLIAVVAEFSGQTLVEGIKFQLQTAERQWVYVVRRGAEDEYEIVKIRFFNEILIASQHSTACVKVLLEPLQSADVDRYQGENAETVDYSWRL